MFKNITIHELTTCQRYLVELAWKRKLAGAVGRFDYLNAYDPKLEQTIKLLVVNDLAFWLAPENEYNDFSQVSLWHETQPKRHSRDVYNKWMLEVRYFDSSGQNPSTVVLVRSFVDRMARKPTAAVFRIGEEPKAQQVDAIDWNCVSSAFSASSSSGEKRWNPVCGILVMMDGRNAPSYVVFPYWSRLGNLARKTIRDCLDKLSERTLEDRKRYKEPLPRWNALRVLFFDLPYEHKRRLEDLWEDAESCMFLDEAKNAAIDEYIFNTLW